MKFFFVNVVGRGSRGGRSFLGKVLDGATLISCGTGTILAQGLNGPVSNA